MITINIMLLLKIIGISYVISQFEPIQWVIDYLPGNLLKHTLHLLFGCFKCVSFWTTIIATGSIWFAVFNYFIVKSISTDDTFNYYTGLIKTTIKEWFKKKKMAFYKRAMDKIIKEVENEGI